MNKKIKIFKCDKCGNIIIKLNDCGNDDFFCCNQLMEFLEPNRTEIGSEKHIPFIAKKTTNKNTTNISVRIGEIEHPFSNSHYIEWIGNFSDHEWTIKWMKSFSEKPEKNISIDKDSEINLYSYCNVHGLWKK